MSEFGTTDEQLVSQYQATGDAQALDLLFRRHLPRVRTMAYAMVLDDADADDLTQEIFVRVARYLHRFEGRSTFATWLHRVSINATHRFLSRRGQQRARQVESEADEPAPEHHRPDRSLAHGELDEAVTAAMGRLKPALRTALVLTVMQDVPMR